MSRYYVHDQESQKLHIHTGGKADWLTIPEADRDAIKRACLWSSRNNCWVSRAKGDKVRILAHFYPSDVLARNGFEDRGEVGERLSFAEQQEQKSLRAEDRAERFEHRTQAATAEAHARFNSHNVETLRGLQGEPVKLGHHSAKRHLRLIEKADNDMRKGCEAYHKSQHYASRAEAARATASQANLSDRGFLGRRIHDCEAELRQIRRLAAENPDNDAYLARLEDRAEEVADRLAFYRECLEACGGVRYSKANVKPGDLVLIRGDWHEVVRANPTTVAVPNICFRTPETQRKWALKYPYAEIQDHRPAGVTQDTAADTVTAE